MAPPAVFTADAAGRGPAPPDPAGAPEEWLASTFGKALFVSQEDRSFLFVRTRTRASGAPVLVLTGATDGSAADSEFEVPMAALRETSTPPHIAKVFLSLFNNPVSLADEEVTAVRARAGDATVQKIVATRLKSDGVTTTRGQSTLKVSSFLSLVAPKLTSVELVLPTGRGGGEQMQPAQHEPHPAMDRLSCAPLRKLLAMATIAEALTPDEPSLAWADAEAFLSAALGRPVAGKTAAISAAMRLDAKLVATSKTKAALKAALDMARAAGMALSMTERGELLAAQGIPSASPSPAAQQRPAAKRKEREPAAPPTQHAEVDGDDVEDDDDGEGSGGSESGGSDDEDEPEEPDQQAVAQQARPAPQGQTAAPQGAAGTGASGDRAHKQKKSARRGDDAFSPGTDLARLTPAGWKASQVARVLFDEPLLSETAKYAERPQRDSDSDAEDLTQRRVAFAVRRLKEASGSSWIPQERVASKQALKEVREQVFHLVARGPGQSAAPASASQRPYGVVEREGATRRVFVDVDAPEPPTANLAAATPELAPEHKAGAVLPDVVERLHAGSSLLAYEPGGDVGVGIRSAPEHLRLDLARAVGSNGRVDAAGERSSARSTLPGAVLRMHRALVGEVQDALQQLTGEDESGFQHMYDKSAHKLAEAAVCGLFVVQDYIQEVAKVTVSRLAPKHGSLAELKGAWRYIRVALAASASPLYGMQMTDAGLRKIDNRLGATAASLPLDAANVQGWLRRVLDKWAGAVARFRADGSTVPSMADCVQAHENHFQFTTLTASVRDEIVGALPRDVQRQLRGRTDDEAAPSQQREGQGRQGRRGRGDGGKPPDGGQAGKDKRTQARGKHGKRARTDHDGQGAGASRARQKESNPSCAWPGKPKMSDEQFDAFRKEVREKCPDVCNFFLIGTCKKDSASCPYPHEIPEAFHEVKQKFAK